LGKWFEEHGDEKGTELYPIQVRERDRLDRALQEQEEAARKVRPPQGEE